MRPSSSTPAIKLRRPPAHARSGAASPVQHAPVPRPSTSSSSAAARMHAISGAPRALDLKEVPPTNQIVVAPTIPGPPAASPCERERASSGPPASNNPPASAPASDQALLNEPRVYAHKQSRPSAVAAPAGASAAAAAPPSRPRSPLHPQAWLNEVVHVPHKAARPSPGGSLRGLGSSVSLSRHTQPDLIEGLKTPALARQALTVGRHDGAAKHAKVSPKRLTAEPRTF